MHELPLIIFTLLVQCSVGIVLFVTLSLIYAGNHMDIREKCRYALPAMLVAFIAGALGLMVSTAHLGYPLNAFHALRHVESSWLSREIIFASLYLGILGLVTLIALLTKRVWTVLLLIATLLGLIDVFCMGAIYVHSSVVTWMHSNTYWMFYGATIGLGAVVCLWSFASRPNLPAEQVKKVAVTAVGLVIAITLCRLVEQPLYMGYLASLSNSDAITFPHQPLSAFQQLSNLRLTSWIVLIVGVGALTLSLRAPRISKKMLVLGSVLVIAAEVLLRFSFFSIN